MMAFRKTATLSCLLLGILVSLAGYFTHPQTWVETRTQFESIQRVEGDWVLTSQGQQEALPDPVPYQQSPLRQAHLDTGYTPTHTQQWVIFDDADAVPFLLKAERHYGLWSLIPAMLAIALCLLTREPLLALFSGIVAGALLLGQFDISSEVLVPSVGTESAASILILYLWLLGGLMGIWSKTGAALAFAEWVSQRFVTGPVSAKLVAWGLGVLFFQGGTMSTVLVGTTVKPLADKAGVSHEELSYVVDSTASPIASVLAFNAWPAYVQALIFVPGVAFLATEADRLAFFFASVPLSFYGIFAVGGTLLVSLGYMKFAGAPLRNAAERAATTGQLDAPHANPVSARELHQVDKPQNYHAHWLEFVLPLIALIGVAVTTFAFSGSPQIHWAFAAALALSVAVAMLKGMSLRDVLGGFATGWKGVVVASVILMLAITLGVISKQLGGGLYLIELMGQNVPYWLLPLLLQTLTMLIAFSTGTSWGTYAIAFPLAMPLVWSVAVTQGVDNPQLFMMICFATVLNGSVYGDQCSPISDTTILSSMTTGCDLMDHVKTQIVPASFAALLAAALWMLVTVLWV